MTRLLVALAAAFCLASCAEPASGPAREWPQPSPALWEVTGRHGEQSWLFGTIHALPDGVEWRTPALERATSAADLLLVEIGNLDDAREARTAFETYAKAPPQAPLTARVAPENRPALKALLERAGMADDDFAQVETWAAALILANSVRQSETGNGVDRALLAEAARVQALETFAQQFERFDRLDADAQDDLLVGVALEAELEASDQRVETWLTGDLASLEAQLAQSVLNRPVLREALIVERNKYFAARIAALMERGFKPFTAVGAGHMLGPEGLPALLAARGYGVRRIQ